MIVLRAKLMKLMISQFTNKPQIKMKTSLT